MPRIISRIWTRIFDSRRLLLTPFRVIQPKAGRQLHTITLSACKIIAALSPSAYSRLEIVGEDAIREARQTRETRMYRPVRSLSCCQTRLLRFCFSLSLSLSLSSICLPRYA